MKNILAICLFTILLTSCIGGRGYLGKSPLTSINIIDRNGFSETISTEERLNQYSQVNFLSPLPYQKVVRVYRRQSNGDIKSIITSYYPNGQVRQYLDVINGRAYGYYREWHENGTQKIEAYVIGGNADIDTAGEGAWLFEGTAHAWDENGRLSAEIPYEKGALNGVAKYYHTNGNLWKVVPNKNNVAEGKVEVYLEDGSLLSTSHYHNGFKEGESIRYWSPESKASVEFFDDGFLISGEYYDVKGKSVSNVTGGVGKRAIFGKDYITELQSIDKGLPNGECRVYDKEGKLIRKYHIKDEVKNGEEIFFYETVSKQQPKLSIEWIDGIMTGIVKTWYPNGQQESQREMENNLKNGLATAWYMDGQVMFIEEYQRDRLKKGKYFKRGEKDAISKVENGLGVAFIYDGKGNLINKVPYLHGRPLEDKDHENN